MSKNKHEQPIINCLSASFVYKYKYLSIKSKKKKLYWRVSVLQKKGEHEKFSNKAHEANEKKNEFTLSKNFSKSVWNECKNNKPKKRCNPARDNSKKKHWFGHRLFLYLNAKYNFTPLFIKKILNTKKKF